MKGGGNVMSEEERRELAKKLDDELDLFMDELARNKEASGKERKAFDFDEWSRELDEHPIFMKELKPGQDGKYSEHIQALQAMKFEDEDTEEEKQASAERHKMEGNKHFQLKKYRWASECYTEGIVLRVLDRHLNAVLYANRASAQKRLGNLRSAVRDCVFARRFDPHHLKAIVRGAECLLELGYAQRAIDWLDSSKGLREAVPASGDETADDTKQLEALEKLRADAVKTAVVEERNRRKERVESRKDLAEKKKLLDALAKRKLRLQPPITYEAPDIFEWSELEVQLPQFREHTRVTVEDGVLHWPLLIQFPEVGMMNGATQCSEESAIVDLLAPILECPEDWDPEHKFRADNVRFFVSDEHEEVLTEIAPLATLAHMLNTKDYRILNGLPIILVYTKAKVEKEFKRIRSNVFVVS